MLLALAATLSLLQPPAAPPAGALTLTNVRSTYGSLGGTRPMTALIPGDVLYLAFDIEGVAVDAESKVAYSMAMEVTDKGGKAIYKQDPANKADFVPLGGGKLPGKAYITVGLDQPPGEYNLKVTVVDLATKATKALDQKFTVLPPDFGIVAVYPSIDERGEIPAPTTVVVGQQVFVQFGVVGFARAKATKQPNIAVEMLPFDEQGGATMPKPITFKLDAGIEEKEPGVTVRFLLPLTRPGKYTVRLKATDSAAEKPKTSSFSLPLTVVSPAN